LNNPVGPTTLDACAACGGTVDTFDTWLCNACGLDHGSPCTACGRRGLHADTCPEVMIEEFFALQHLSREAGRLEAEAAEIERQERAGTRRLTFSDRALFIQERRRVEEELTTKTEAFLKKWR
jgi:hypothetical protein